MAKIIKYAKLLGKRVYRPVKPVLNPLLKKVKLWQVLAGLIGLMLAGSFWPVSQNYQAQEKAAWWPWSSTVHSQMALAWLNSGNEEAAFSELKLAKKRLLIKTKRAETALNKAEAEATKLVETRKEIEIWEKVLGTKTEYRDIYLRLSWLYAELFNNNQARLYWEKANYLDPNNEEVKKVGEIIFSLQP